MKSMLVLGLGLLLWVTYSLLYMPPSSVKSVENIVKFCRYLKTYLHNLAYPT